MLPGSKEYVSLCDHFHSILLFSHRLLVLCNTNPLCLVLLLFLFLCLCPPSRSIFTCPEQNSQVTSQDWRRHPHWTNTWRFWSPVRLLSEAQVAWMGRSKNISMRLGNMAWPATLLGSSCWCTLMSFLSTVWSCNPHWLGVHESYSQGMRFNQPAPDCVRYQGIFEMLFIDLTSKTEKQDLFLRFWFFSAYRYTANLLLLLYFQCPAAICHLWQSSINRMY